MFEGETCDIDAEHSVASIRELYGRECLIATVWGPPRARLEQLHTRQRSNQALSGLAALGTVAGMLASTMFFPAASAATAILGGALSGSFFWLFGKRALASVEHTYPVGAEPISASVTNLRQSGTVIGPMDLVAPASGCECLAYAIELHYESDFGTRVMFRDAICNEFEIVLDDEQIVHVPAGRVRIFGPMHQQIDFDNLALESYVDDFDPRRASTLTFDPLRYNIVCEQIIFPSDRVELANTLRPMIDRAAPLPHYRESMPTYLVPIGVPGLSLSDTSPRLEQGSHYTGMLERV